MVMSMYSKTMRLVNTFRLEGRLATPSSSRNDIAARWRKPHKFVRSVLGYQEKVVIDSSGGLLAHRVTLADSSDFAGIEPLLDRLPLDPTSLRGDTGYRSGRLRYMLRR